MLLQQVAKLSQDIAAPEALQPMLTAAPVVTGLVAGTLVEGSKGWHPIETFRVGDSVQTLDGGLARILKHGARE